MNKNRPKILYKKVKDGYKLTYPVCYYSKRYWQFIFLPNHFFSDGATWAIDIGSSKSWWIHDKLKKTGKWDSGDVCSNWEASCVLGDILRSEGRYVRSVTWKYSTFVWGEVRRRGWRQ